MDNTIFSYLTLNIFSFSTEGLYNLFKKSKTRNLENQKTPKLEQVLIYFYFIDDINVDFAGSNIANSRDNGKCFLTLNPKEVIALV